MSSVCCPSGEVFSTTKLKCVKSVQAITSKEEANTEAITSSVMTAATGAVIVGALMVGSPDLAVSMLMTIELITYLPLIDLDFTKHETNLLVGSNQLDSLTGFFPGIHCIEARSRSSSYNFKCSSLFKNAQKEILILILALLIQLTERCLTKDGSAESEARLKSLRSIKVKLMLIVCFGFFIKSSVQCLSYAESSFQTVAGWAFALAIFGLYQIWAVLNLLNRASCYNYPELKLTRACQSTYGLLILHRLIYAGTIVMLDYPVVQFSLLSLTTYIVSPKQFAFYLMFVRPYTDFGTNFKQIALYASVATYNFTLLLKALSVISISSAVSIGFLLLMSVVVLAAVLSLVIAVVQKVADILRAEDSEVLDQ
jgi:hypothetical protein